MARRSAFLGSGFRMTKIYQDTVRMSRKTDGAEKSPVLFLCLMKGEKPMWYVLKDNKMRQIWVVGDSAEELEQRRQEQSDPSFYYVSEASEKDLAWCRKNGII